MKEEEEDICSAMREQATHVCQRKRPSFIAQTRAECVCACVCVLARASKLVREISKKEAKAGGGKGMPKCRDFNFMRRSASHPTPPPSTHPLLSPLSLVHMHRTNIYLSQPHSRSPSLYPSLSSFFHLSFFRCSLRQVKRILLTLINTAAEEEKFSRE